MRSFSRPKIFVSKCLTNCHCRYDGSAIHNEIVETLKNHVDIVTTCPEVAIGLTVPREALRIVKHEETQEESLVFSYSGKDMTKEMTDFALDYLSSEVVAGVDGFILKHKSPSCGTNEVKCYKGSGKSSALPGKTTGFFGRVAMNQFGDIPIENEGRLLNYNIREQFFIRIFMNSDFRAVANSGKMSELIRFHRVNKYLLMAMSQKYLSELGKIVANHESRTFEETIRSYQVALTKALSQSMTIGRNMNTLLHVFGYFKKHLSVEEKAFFLEQLEAYNEKRIPFSVVLKILQAWVIRFDEPYLKEQTLFEPFPLTLFEVTDSGKGL